MGRGSNHEVEERSQRTERETADVGGGAIEASSGIVLYS